MIRRPRAGPCAHARWIRPPGGRTWWRFPAWTGRWI
nr:MAG TPA: hypothetical protein [Caudoviricetes sp.]DAQ28783.1 MAG TPA: hypothetical protein [Caudoviricetes sp.]DAZ15835.1 MAG TPA: hypothetical protein [Caudoviricetes sp.]